MRTTHAVAVGAAADVPDDQGGAKVVKIGAVSRQEAPGDETPGQPSCPWAKNAAAAEARTGLGPEFGWEPGLETKPGVEVEVDVVEVVEVVEHIAADALVELEAVGRSAETMDSSGADLGLVAEAAALVTVAVEDAEAAAAAARTRKEN